MTGLKTIYSTKTGTLEQVPIFHFSNQEKQSFASKKGLNERYYVLDAQGNEMSTYEREIISSTIYYSQKERYIYGSSRLGVMNDSIPLYGSQNNTYSQTTWTHGIGKRNYELSNHLGNVLSVVSDKVILEEVSNPVVYTNNFSSTYSPFAVSAGITLALASGRLRATNVVANQEVYMNQSTVSGHGYRVSFTLDLNGGAGVKFFAVDVATNTVLLSKNISSNGVYTYEITATGTATKLYIQNGTSSTPRILYLDNFSVRDIAVTGYLADIIQSTDYSPFGAPMPGRQFNSSSYRYGYQGYEGDPEMKGNGNSYTTEFRQYDPRLGRWLTTDPIIHEYQGPYCGFDNNPILHTDPKGTTVNGDYYDVKTGKKLGTDGINDGKVFEISKSQWNKLSSEAAPNYGDQSFQNASYAYGSKQVYGSEANAYIFGTKSKTYESQQAVAKTQQQSKEMVRPQNVPKPKPVATQPQVANVPAPQPSDQFGIGGTNTVQLPLAVSTAPPVTESESSGVSGTTVTGILMAASGEPWINKSSSFAKLIFPRSATVMGAQPMTSFSSLAVRRATTSLGVKGATGRIASRAIPIVREGLLIWDGLDFLWTNREAFGYGMQLRQEYIDQGLIPLR